MLTPRKMKYRRQFNPKIKAVAKKGYNLDFGNYGTGQITLIKAVYGKNSDKSNPSTVFCSELAAKMLMDLDIIQKDNKAASNYLPSDFQNSKGVRLNQGFILTPEIVVK